MSRERCAPAAPLPRGNPPSVLAPLASSRTPAGALAPRSSQLGMAASVQAIVEADLRTLSLEARRRHPEVKEAAERALQRLRTAVPEGASPAEQAAALAQAEEVLLPFTMALAPRSDAMPLCALGAIQRLISHRAIAPPQLPGIISQLLARVQSSEEAFLLKALQTALIIASSPALLYRDAVVRPLPSPRPPSPP